MKKIEVVREDFWDVPAWYAYVDGDLAAEIVPKMFAERMTEPTFVDAYVAVRLYLHPAEFFDIDYDTAVPMSRPGVYPYGGSGFTVYESRDEDVPEYTVIPNTLAHGSISHHIRRLILGK